MSCQGIIDDFFNPAWCALPIILLNLFLKEKGKPGFMLSASVQLPDKPW